jgi:predicted alpha/beta superfamily hydrolase
MRLYFSLPVIIFLTFCSTKSFAQSSSGNEGEFRITGTEIRTIHSDITGQDYQLIINLPYSYKTDTTKYYPVVYFCDGYYDFALLSMIYGEQIYDKTIKECFMVGFSYKGENLDYGKLRTHDYTPTAVPDAPGSGGAAEFLDVVEKEFIPFMQEHYRVDTSFRALGGSSLGGLFTLYALFSRPQLFNAYISLSPAVLWDRGYLLLLEDSFQKNHTALPVSLYMTGAEKEIAWDPTFLEGIKFFGAVLKKRNYADFRFEYRVLDDSYHSGSKPEGYARGIKFIFEPLMEK